MSTRWKPDTCGCIVVYDSRVTPPKKEPEIINIRFEQSCPTHALIEEYGARFRAVQETNRRGR